MHGSRRDELAYEPEVKVHPRDSSSLLYLEYSIVNGREHAEIDLEPFEFVSLSRSADQALYKSLPFVARLLPESDRIIGRVRRIGNDRIQRPQILEASFDPVFNKLRYHGFGIAGGLFQRTESLGR